MRYSIATILLILTAGCITNGQMGNQRILTLDEAIQVVADLRIGLPQAEVDSVLKKHGLSQVGWNLGCSHGWADGCSLSPRYSLNLCYRAASDRDDDTRANGVLERIDILDGKDFPSSGGLVLSITPLRKEDAKSK